MIKKMVQTLGSIQATLRLTNVGLLFLVIFAACPWKSFGAEDLSSALRRAQYLLNATMPTDTDFFKNSTHQAYYAQVRSFLNHENFYKVMLRYHQRVFGVGLPNSYIDELMRDDIDNKTNKFASIACQRQSGPNARFRCFWSSANDRNVSSGCPESDEVGASVFWYPGIVAWVCPSVINSCGHDLSNCFIRYSDEAEAKNSELGTTEVFDSRFAVINSLSKQSAGIATAVVMENYPYTRILEPGLTALDGAIAHFYRQPHHFKIDSLHINGDILKFARTMPLTNTRFQLVSSGLDYASGGILTTFGWLRRYDKNRTRANQLYERLLCKQFTSELPAVFPQDPGDLRTTPGCRDCHSVLDPLADFFKAWGEEGNLYVGGRDAVNTYFSAAGCSGNSVADLAQCLQKSRGFATCQVNHIWEWLMARKFYVDEEELRTKLTDYFILTNYNMRELIYAVATHPAFLEVTRSDGQVTEPLKEPALGQISTTTAVTCSKETYNWAADVKPGADSLCISCHGGNTTALKLTTEEDWNAWANDAVTAMNLRDMPRGSPNWTTVQAFANTVRCWKDHH